MKMYNNGLQDTELQLLHKKAKLNMNMFLSDILESDLFQVVTKGNYYYIYPLFYCDRIESDGDAFINKHYLIVCPTDYAQIFLFISDTSININKTYTIINPSGNYWVILIYDEWTFQPLRNTLFSIDYGNDNIKQYTTDKLGYCTFEADLNTFEVIL